MPFIMLVQEDIELIAKLGFKAYRFSISWSRIFPGTSHKLAPFKLPLSELILCVSLVSGTDANRHALMWPSLTTISSVNSVLHSGKRN